ncbi:hypothetical protein DFQ28_009379 [Apophysomyces sp. BC1034]|nr:hypothetical protein DFQ28_009379 [Apophysomyces sp. BC1034]
MASEREALEARILRVAATNSELPDFPDDKSDLPSDYEYNPDEEEEEVEEFEEITENELLQYLDQQENPLNIAQRLFYNEVNTTQSQAHCGAREEAEQMREQDLFCQASNLKTDDEDPFRDVKARDDAIMWLDPASKTLPVNLQKIMTFFDGPLHQDLATMIKLKGRTEYQLAYYHPDNARYERHRDAFPTDDPEDTHQRRVTAICYINPQWMPGDGGELKLFGRPDMAEPADRTISPLLGRIVLFLSGVVDHAVLPANKERFAVTAWMRPFDNEKAVLGIHQGYKALLNRPPATKSAGDFPRLITMGGDHTITLPILRSIHAAYGPVSVIHFDSHLDSWSPYTDGESKPDLNHGTYFYFASEEGLIRKNESVHGGIRCPIFSPEDYKQDADLGFQIIEARDIDSIGVRGIIDRIRNIVGDNYVYLSIDIDTLDPAYAPGTGTPETGGWSTREFRSIIRGLEGLKIVGADLVEVAPAYDTNAQVTAIAAADLLFDVLSVMIKTRLKA